MYPLFDSYSNPVRAASAQVARVAPVLAPLDVIPRKLLVVVGSADILAREEMAFVEHVTGGNRQEFEGREGTETRSRV